MLEAASRAPARGRRADRQGGGPLERSARRPVLRPPRVVLAEGLLPMIHETVMRSHRGQKEEIETGGMLVGEFAREEGSAVFKLSGLIDAGPQAECCSDSILFDTEYQARMLQVIRLQYPEVGNMGCIHLHPGEMDECSAGDQLADRAAVQESDTKALVFGIITRNNPRPDSFSVAWRELKIDFFVMAEQTGLEYVHVRPAVADVPVVRAARALAGLALNSAVRFRCHHAAAAAGLLADKRRLVAEVRAMEERYGDRAVLRYEKGQLYWKYMVVESGRRFPIEVRYPRRYPLEPPRVVSLLPLPSSPHQLVNNELCWINRSSGDWNPSRDTAATSINAAHRWFACLLVYLTIGQWPEEANDEPIRQV